MMLRQVSVSDYPLIEVHWDDHWIENEDVTMEHVKKGCKPYTGKYSGYLVHETKQMLAIASNVWEDGDVGPVMYIMKRSITFRSDKKK